MRAFHLTKPSLDSLRRVDVPTPSPAPGEVLIRLRAASLNYLDLMVARGQFPVPAYPFIPGCDGAGDIVALADDVTGWTVGDRVAPGLMVDWAAGQLTAANGKRLRGVTLPGSLAECVAVPASALVRIPDQVSYLEAATLPIAGTTAWNAIRAGRVRPGSTVLLLGAGGVSLFALQFAKAAGARVIITSSSDAKLERARALGADDTINHQTVTDWDAAVLAMTGGNGVDLVVETVGAATFARSLNAVAIGGTIFVVGLLSGHEITLPVIPILLKTVTIRGNNTGSTADFADAMRAVATARIKPVIDRRFAFDDAPAAYRFLESGGHFGKVAIDFAL
jgi:NADPH:quinone reductase-like Zn-dependent oxidoreductase